MTDKEREQIQELKIYTLIAPTVIPLLRKRKDNVFNLLLSDYRSGKTDYITRIAELNALDSLEREFHQKQQELTYLEEKHVTAPKK